MKNQIVLIAAGLASLPFRSGLAPEARPAPSPHLHRQRRAGLRLPLPRHQVRLLTSRRCRAASTTRQRAASMPASRASSISWRWRRTAACRPKSAWRRLGNTFGGIWAYVSRRRTTTIRAANAGQCIGQGGHGE